MNRKSIQTKPFVSVIMPVYNAGDYLVEALDSVFAQTYKNIEVIAINDGSKDNSYKILKKYAKKEPRLYIFSNVKNMGIGYSANLGGKYAHGEFIARMDADDITPPYRIEKQVDYLLKNEKVVVVGGQVELVNEYKSLIVEKRFPTKHKEIIDMAFLAMPIQQGAMMVNKRLLPKDFIWYRTKLKTSEDLDFFMRVFKYGEGANIDSIVLYYRQHGKSLTQAENPKGILFQAFKVRLLAIFEYGMTPSFITIFLSLLQFLIVLVIPSSFIYPLYYIWRGLRPFNLSKKNYFPLLRHAITYLF